MPRPLSPFHFVPWAPRPWVRPAQPRRWRLSVLVQALGRRRWLWWGVGGLLAFEALALAVVCLWQIRVAEVRQTEARQRAARYVQCLQEMPGASFARCRRRAASSP